ncbi:MAG: NAD(P)H-binding protein [Maribacter sp.]|nr:NAD(P)H-binding protein [Maribacter sp.]
MKTAIILGATGLTGGMVLELLLKNNSYNKVKWFGRSPVRIKNPKIEEHLGDLFHLDNFKKDFIADEVYCCIGTTKSKTPNKALYRKIDFGIPKNAAKLAKENGISTFTVISALGASIKSPIFYNRIKGEMEEAVLHYGIQRTYILQPSLIAGKRNEKRIGEWLFKQLMKVANLVLAGPLDKYKSIQPGTIAQCMVWLANNPYDRVRIESDEIRRIVSPK